MATLAPACWLGLRAPKPRDCLKHPVMHLQRVPRQHARQQLCQSFTSFAVVFGRTVSSTPFSRKAASYCSRPRLRSQLAASRTAPKLSFEVHHRPGERPCPGHRAEASSVVGLKGPPRRTELALFPNLVSWLARMNARREFPSNGVGARRGAGQKRLDRIRWPRLQMKNPGGIDPKSPQQGAKYDGSLGEIDY